MPFRSPIGVVTACAISLWLPASFALAQSIPVLRYASDVPGALIKPNSSLPDTFTRSGSTIYFAATTPELGRELWAYDSTAHLVKDVALGSARGLTASHGIAPLPGNRALFFADDGLGSGTLLWVTDGTPEGSRQLRDQTGAPVRIVSPNVTKPFGFLPNGRVLFLGYTPDTGMELWSTDGTDANTSMLADLSPGTFSTQATFLYDSGPLVYFSFNGTLWRTDGTATGIVNLGTSLFSPKFVTLGAFDYFLSDEPAALWRTDGTIAGTSRLFSPSQNAILNSRELAVTGSNLVFAYDDAVHGAELWKFDTTTSTPSMIADIYPGAQASNPSSLTSVGNQVLFAATTPDSGTEPWATDGTTAGTHALADLNPGTGSSIFYGVSFRTDGSRAFFNAYVPPLEWLFVTDGTTAGTRALAPYPSNSGINFPLTGEFLSDGSSRFVYQGGDAANGYELWISDGTPTGTHLLADIAAGTSSVPAIGPYLRSATPQHATIGVNGRFYFPVTVPGPQYSQVALAEGTAAPGSAQIIRTFTGGLTELAPFAGRIYFPANDGVSGVELFSSDGTSSGTSLVADIAPASSGPRSLTGVGSQLFFAASPTGSFTIPGSSPCTLFTATAGASGATQVVSNTAAGLPRLSLPDGTFRSGQPEMLTPALGKAFFVASTNPSNFSGPDAVFVSDGTDQGTIQLAFLARTASFAEWQGRVYFVGRSTATSSTISLESTDGTLLGTSVIASVPISTTILAATSDHLFMAITDAASVYQLWVLDQSSSTLRQLTSFTGSSTSIGIVYGDKTPLGNRLLFAAGDSSGGVEPWVSDGTVAGTMRLADMVPGALSSSPMGFTVVGSTAYFIAAAPDGVGTRLYQTDGTPAGTFATPIAPGPHSISPFALDQFSLAQTNGRLYVAAANPDAMQVWYLDTCFADFDASGRVDINDLFEFLAAWFSADPHADTDANGEIAVADIFSFLALWFAGCP